MVGLLVVVKIYNMGIKWKGLLATTNLKHEIPSLLNLVFKIETYFKHLNKCNFSRLFLCRFEILEYLGRHVSTNFLLLYLVETIFEKSVVPYICAHVNRRREQFFLRFERSIMKLIDNDEYLPTMCNNSLEVFGQEKLSLNRTAAEIRNKALKSI